MRYFVGFLVTIGLLIVLVVLLFSGGGGDKPTTPLTLKNLETYATTQSEVRLTIDGPVNAESLHEQIQISVSQDNVTFEHLKGYEGNSVNLQDYSNNRSAYSVFLLSLAKSAGFTRGNPSAELKDERGYCPLGSRYIFELIEEDQTLMRYWATSCGSPKTYLGNAPLTLELFKAQVPDYAIQTNGIRL